MKLRMAAAEALVLLTIGVSSAACVVPPPPPPSPNLVVNGDFETGTTEGWSGPSQGFFFVRSDPGPAGFTAPESQYWAMVLDARSVSQTFDVSAYAELIDGGSATIAWGFKAYAGWLGVATLSFNGAAGRTDVSASIGESPIDYSTTTQVPIGTREVQIVIRDATANGVGFDDVFVMRPIAG